MRHRWLLVVAIVGTQAVRGAPNPVPAPGPANPKALQAESRRFAHQMNAVVDQVAEKYVRAVNREDLIEAAMAGLFEAARKPVPRDLRAQVRQAVALTSALRAQSGDANSDDHARLVVGANRSGPGDDGPVAGGGRRRGPRRRFTRDRVPGRGEEARPLLRRGDGRGTTPDGESGPGDGRRRAGVPPAGRAGAV